MRKGENALYYVLDCFLHRKKIEINGVTYQVATCGFAEFSCENCDFSEESELGKVQKDICDTCIDAEGYVKSLREFHYLKKTDQKTGKIFRYGIEYCNR